MLCGKGKLVEDFPFWIYGVNHMFHTRRKQRIGAGIPYARIFCVHKINDKNEGDLGTDIMKVECFFFNPVDYQFGGKLFGGKHVVLH